VYLRYKDIQLIYLSPHGNGHYLVVRQSEVGEGSTVFDCQKVTTKCEKNVIHWVKLFIELSAATRDTQCQLETDRSCLGTRPGFVVSTCKAYNIWLCNCRVSRPGGSGPGRPSGMTKEGSSIMAREESNSEGSCSSSIEILGGTAIDDILASEEVIYMFFPRVRAPTRLLGLTLAGIADAKRGITYWTGEQGVAVAAVREGIKW